MEIFINPFFRCCTLDSVIVVISQGLCPRFFLLLLSLLLVFCCCCYSLHSLISNIDIKCKLNIVLLIVSTLKLYTSCLSILRIHMFSRVFVCYFCFFNWLIQRFFHLFLLLLFLAFLFLRFIWFYYMKKLMKNVRSTKYNKYQCYA